jgi:hypothetical protein
VSSGEISEKELEEFKAEAALMKKIRPHVNIGNIIKTIYGNAQSNFWVLPLLQIRCAL